MEKALLFLMKTAIAKELDIAEIPAVVIVRLSVTSDRLSMPRR